MKTISMVIAGAALLAGPAAAAPGSKPAPKEEWVRVGSYVDGGAVEVDRRSIVTSQGLMRAWWRTSFAQPRPDGTVQEKQLIAVDCGEELSTALAAIAFDGEGAVIEDVREAESAALDRLGPATPGTTGETVARAVCAMRPVPKRR